ncbi:MAG: TIGR03621 family F420-dependent LLM class oxidoreductase [Candidatus Limnocylindria bacterium]
MRPFRFLADPGEITDARSVADAARRAEAIGIDVLVIPDHVVQPMAPLPVLAAIAAAAERVRIGTFVLNNDLRHPAVLAQELATLDGLSGGRLEIGIGAGWNRPEYEAVGLAFDPVRVRVDRLEESIRVLKGCFADGPFSFAGAHYTLTDYEGVLKPVQRPHPPFFIGGGGRRLLTLAAREADAVGLAPRTLPNVRGDPRSVTMAATEEKIGWVREAAGDRFGDLELNVYPSLTGVTVTDQPRKAGAELAERLRDRTGVEMSVDDLLESPHIFISTTDGFVEKFTVLRERLGISSIMVGSLGELDAVVERLAGT